MFVKRVLVSIGVVLLSASLAAAGNNSTEKTDQQTDRAAQSAPAASPMTKETRMLVIRSINAESVFVRKPFPMGKDGLTLKNGKITPDDQQLEVLMAQYGTAAKPGDRAKITDVVIKDKLIHIEINGGPKKKEKWYKHIQVSGMGGSTTPGGPSSSEPLPKGSYVDLVFDKYVPEMTGNQVRELLTPVLDFRSRSAAEAYLDTVPPKVKQAIANHEVLVGMNREMVIYAKGRPDQKIREKDPTGNEYEEWIYGRPPKEVAFVRFVGDEVTRLELMRVDGAKTVRTDKEVDIGAVQVKVVPKKPESSPGDMSPTDKPSMRRPGEKPDEQ